MSDIKLIDKKQLSSFEKNLPKYIEFSSWTLWNPDLFLDLIKPKTGGVNLSSDQRLFLRSITRFFSLYGCFPRGYGKCVSGSTLLFTDKGIKEIGEFFDYQDDDVEQLYRCSINLLNRDARIVNSDVGIYSGYKDTKIITTEEGYSLEGTFVHPILSIDINGEIKFKQLMELQIGDYIAINRKNNIWGNKIDINYQNEMAEWLGDMPEQSKLHLKLRGMPTILNEDIALYLGYLIGNGCLIREDNVIFSNKDSDILDNFFRITQDIFKSDNPKFASCVSYKIYDKYLRKYLEIIGLGYVNSFDKSIPKIIMESTSDIVSSFLRGLYDTGGTVGKKNISYTTVSKKLSQQIQIVLLNFGIISKRYLKKDKRGFCSYKIDIYGKNVDKFFKHVGFGTKIKKKKLESILNIERNINKDIIPFQKQYIKDFYKDIKEHNFYVYDNICHILDGSNNLTYENLNYLLSLKNSDMCNNYIHFKNILENNYFFSKIEKIENSRNHTYDLEVSDTNSFVSNGFVSHNTWSEILAMFIVAIRYPNINLSLTAQTKENACEILKSKYYEIIKQYPMIENEVAKTKFNRNEAEILLKNSATISILANSQSSKGQRKHRLEIEESVLLNNELFEDALEPIVEVSRYTSGILSIINPEELHQQINFFSTPGWRGSDEFDRNLKMIKEMIDLKGKMVIGSDWMLGCWYGRGSTKSKILKKKKDMSPIAFDQNYGGKWTGSSSNALVNINKLMSCRVLEKAIFEVQNKSDEFYIGVDVARSQNTNNNQSALVVAKVNRNSSTNRIISIDIVNIISISNILNFTEQACIVKKIANIYEAKMVVIDGNGLGVGLCDELLKTSIDKATGNDLGCWDTINTTNEPEVRNAEKCVFDLKAQSSGQTKIITNFIDVVESGKLKLLSKKQDSDFTFSDKENFKENVLPFVQTDILFEEIGNLKLKQLPSKNLAVEKVVYKIDKDRFSALAYVVFYILEYTDFTKKKKENNNDYNKILSLARPPKMYRKKSNKR